MRPLHVYNLVCLFSLRGLTALSFSIFLETDQTATFAVTSNSSWLPVPVCAIQPHTDALTDRLLSEFSIVWLDDNRLLFVRSHTRRPRRSVCLKTRVWREVRRRSIGSVLGLSLLTDFSIGRRESV